MIEKKNTQRSYYLWEGSIAATTDIIKTACIWSFNIKQCDNGGQEGKIHLQIILSVNCMTSNRGKTEVGSRVFLVFYFTSAYSETTFNFSDIQKQYLVTLIQKPDTRNHIAPHTNTKRKVPLTLFSHSPLQDARGLLSWFPTGIQLEDQQPKLPLL